MQSVRRQYGAPRSTSTILHELVLGLYLMNPYWHIISNQSQQFIQISLTFI